MEKEDLELAEEHVKLAEGLIEKGALDSEGEEKERFTAAALALEKAEANLEEVSEEQYNNLKGNCIYLKTKNTFKIIWIMSLFN